MLPKHFPLDKIPRKLKKALDRIEPCQTKKHDIHNGIRLEFSYFKPKEGYPCTRWIRRAQKILRYAYDKEWTRSIDITERQ